VEASTHQTEPAVQHMAAVNPAITKPLPKCMQKHKINKATSLLAAVEERDESTDSDESAFMIQHAGAVHHNSTLQT